MKTHAIELWNSRKEAAKVSGIDENDYELRNLGKDIDKLELAIYCRLNNVLTSREATKLENDIRQYSFQIELELRHFNQKKRAIFQSRFKELLVRYESDLALRTKVENDRKKMYQKVEALHGLSPREFEEYIAELFKRLGYENVTLTPTSNDKGIDILAKREGVRIAIQCKKYKGVIGSPQMQTFLGAMQHVEAQKGFFVTTSVFSREAEKFAYDHPIELIDGFALAEMIQSAIDK
jgi:restriction system protein